MATLLHLCFVDGASAYVAAAIVLLSAVGIAETRNITAEQRRELIRRAQIWTRTDVAAVDVRRGPKGEGTFAPGATVECTYYEEKFSGVTPKFGCKIDDHLKVKVRYGRNNYEIFAGVA